MKKIVSMVALAAFVFSMNVNAQEPKQAKKEKAKTEKSCSSEEKKSCGSEKKGGCCSSKKMDKKKA
ncbi:MAG: hypothetical protein IE891_07295 [Flavobacteriaceae bacterium]|nr:hypothetical protein [Flavobacteriaceae bacterium]